MPIQSPLKLFPAVWVLPLWASAAEAQSVVITQSTPEGVGFVGAVVERAGTNVAVSAANLTGVSVTGYATATTVPFETSVLGVPGVATDVPPGTRADVLEDLLLTSNLQNPTAGNVPGTGIGVAFDAPVENAPGPDILLFELSPPAGVVPPSGGPTVLGGDPALFSAGGGSVAIAASDYVQFGGNGVTGQSTFFTSAAAPISSLADLETAELDAVITIPGLNLYGTAVDLSDLGVAEGATVTSAQINSIAATGFGPDVALVAGMPATGGGTPTGLEAGIVDGVLELDAFGHQRSDFEFNVFSPQGGTKPFDGIGAPLFTTITVDASDPLSISVNGDYLLDGSVALSETATSVGNAVDAAIGTGLSAGQFTVLRDISDLDPSQLDANLSQLSPEVHASGPVAISVEQADLHLRRLGERYRTGRGDGLTPGQFRSWGDVYGSIGNRDGSGGDRDFDVDLYGVTAGVEYDPLSFLRLGATIGYGAGEADFDGSSSEIDSDAGIVSVYGLVDSPYAYLGLSVGYAFASVDAEREVTGATGGFVTLTDYDQDYTFVGAEIGRDFDVHGLTVTPKFEAAYVNVEREDFAETGLTGLELQVIDSPRVEALFLEPEITAAYDWDVRGMAVRPELSLGYRFDVMDDDVPLVAVFTGSPDAGPIIGEGAGFSGGVFSVGTGVEIDVNDRVTLGARYDGLLDDDYDSHDFSLGAGIKF